MKKFLLTSFFTLSLAGFAFAQEKLAGSIKDEGGDPLPGATIVLKGTSSYAVTDTEGNFSIAPAKEFPFILQVNLVGYKQQEIEIYELTEESTDITLQIENILNEIVVIGYGEVKRKDITGSVASVPAELKAQPVSSPERLLQGATAGVQVTQTSGQPGGGVSIQIRGNNSITAVSDPLYVIDGFPINNDYSINDAGVTDGPKLNPLSTISPSDIESIDVLKDASATAIYGSRGANGVIIVTTKKGSKGGKSSIHYDGYYGVQKVIRTIPVLNAREWWELRKEAYANTPNGKAATLPASGTFNYDTTGAGTDWQGAAFTEAPIQSHSLSILTGSDKTGIAFSGNYFKQEGILRNTGFDRYAARINVEHDINERFTFTSYITGSYTIGSVAPQAIVPNLLLTSPAIPVYDTLGNFVRNTSTDSPLQNPINSLLNQINESRTTRFLANVAGEYKLTEELSFKVLLGTDIVLNKQNRYLPNSTYEGNPSGGVGTGGIATIGTSNTISWLNENTLSYSKIFNGIHNINAVVGFTAQASDTKGEVASAATFAFDDLTYNALQNGTGTRTPGSFASSWQLASFLGRINYILREKYLLTVTLRADGSSRFGGGNKWGYFPSAALGWNLNEESFLEDIQEISILKLRLSAGVTGNQGIVPYSSISQIAPYRYNFSNATVQGYAPNSVNNPNLGWEQTFQTNIGIDLGLFDNRVNIVADYYQKKTTDLLLNASVPGSSGLSYYDPSTNTSQASTIYQNIGAVENKGVEVAVNAQTLRGSKLTWNTLFVFSKNSNKITDLGAGIDRIIPNISQPSVLQVGAPVGSFLVYQTDGLIKPEEAGSTALTPQADKTAGGQKYKDISGPNGVPDGVITQTYDRVIIKNQPGINLGLTNTIKYKTPVGDIDLTIFFQSSLGAKLYNNNRATLELGTGYYNGSKDMLNRYSATNTDTDVKEAYQDPAVTISDRFIENASYLRLKNVTIGYTFPKAWTARIKIQGLRIYGSAQNLWTKTDYTGYDPEASFSGQSLINRGIDNGVYPNSKSILGGVSLTF
ncbi:SusC/RagA family TonB-linked outer membrane protein [Ohtaekwangia koreensis]|uniref:TonB-linked outer membrane protein, SusC/RagA family n=1 Tax=Ohtaekwangia koreensis TaxID=688867 RepID=A0A1T5M6M0_9BACT|nr:TonB-dependent receptor [Ohtaekwangia koreensis]SKC83870.1 TonB-linked outer membrane protein, SusC/RagA family [Ohtaekwangia koreensis]